MVMTDEEVDARLNSADNLAKRLVVLSLAKKHEGDVSIPTEVKKLIGVLAQGDESQASIGRAFGVSQVTVSHASRGLVGSRHDEDLSKAIADGKADRRNAVAEVEESAHNLALDAMVGALTKLKDNIKAVDKPKDLARIASDMSKISRNIKDSNKESASVTSNVQVLLYSGQQKNERDYEVIDA